MCKKKLIAPTTSSRQKDAAWFLTLLSHIIHLWRFHSFASWWYYLCKWCCACITWTCTTKIFIIKNSANPCLLCYNSTSMNTNGGSNIVSDVMQCNVREREWECYLAKNPIIDLLIKKKKKKKNSYQLHQKNHFSLGCYFPRFSKLENHAQQQNQAL